MKRKTVTLCMIARDEETCIGRAIKSVLALVDEIVVVDTGSRDNTRIIAEGYGARVLDFVWRDDFAAARNVALAAASSDWVLVLDCDEHLQGIRPLEFQRLLADPSAAGYRVRLAGESGRQQASLFPAVRLFRNHPEVRYRYPVHEQVSPSLIGYAEVTGMHILDAPLTVVHDQGGCDPAARKRERNLRLLRQAAAERPDEPYFCYLLGADALMWLDGEVLPVAGLRGALQHLQAGWRAIAAWPHELRRALPFGAQLGRDLAASLLADGQAGEAAAVAALARRCWGDSAGLALQAVRSGLDQLAAERDPVRREIIGAQVRDDLARTAVQLSAATGSETRRQRAQMLRCEGDLALLEGQVGAAAEAYEQALTGDQEHAAAWVGLAECARLAGDRKRALRLYLRAVTASEWSLRAWERGGSLLEELGFHDNAESWRSRVRDSFPERAPRSPVGATS